jgi:hypothetical protein
MKPINYVRLSVDGLGALYGVMISHRISDCLV